MRSAVVVCLLLLAPRAASADIFSLFGELQAGGQYGQGTSGVQKDSAFFAKSPPAVYGAEVGAEVFIFDGWIQHHQYTDGSRITTWTQFGLGIHEMMDTGSSVDKQQHKGGYFEISAGAWFGVGTGQQISPPLDASQVSDKAFLLEGRLGIGTHLTPLLDLGLEVPVSYGFFFKNGAANDVSNQYRGIQGELLVALRMHVGIL